MRFRPNPAKPDEMNFTFGQHKATSHPAKNKTREDVNQAAARTIREATEKI
jgi:hypothetical protein